MLNLNIIKNLILIAIFLGFNTLSVLANAELFVESKASLSSSGSDRATRYTLSNKIVTEDNKTHFVWAECDYDIKLRTFDHSNNTWGTVVKVGAGSDNHTSPTIAVDHSGYLHLVYGSADPLPNPPVDRCADPINNHNGYFLYKVSKNPNDISQWEATEKFAEYNATYPSMVIDRDNRVHITYRGDQERKAVPKKPRHLLYQRGYYGDWSGARLLVNAEGRATDYANFFHALSITPSDQLHLTFSIYSEIPKPTAPRLLYYLEADRGNQQFIYHESPVIGHIISNYSNSINWKKANDSQFTLPVTTSSPSGLFLHAPKTHMTYSKSNAVDNLGKPWMIVSNGSGCCSAPLSLYHYNGMHWEAYDIRELAPSEVTSIDSNLSLSIDNQNIIYIAGIINKQVGVLYGQPNSQGKVTTLSWLQVTDLPLDTFTPHGPNLERPTNNNSIGTPWLVYAYTEKALDQVCIDNNPNNPDLCERLSGFDGLPSNVVAAKLKHN